MIKPVMTINIHLATLHVAYFAKIQLLYLHVQINITYYLRKNHIECNIIFYAQLCFIKNFVYKPIWRISHKFGLYNFISCCAF